MCLLAGCGAAPKAHRTPADATFECSAATDGPISVWEALRTAVWRRCWPEAVREARAIGGAQALISLRGFVEKHGPLLARTEDFFVLQAAFEALGELIAANDDRAAADEALTFLVEASNPQTWERLGATWPLDAVHRRELIRALTGAAVIGLGVAHREAADARLLVLARVAADQEAVRFGYTTAVDAPMDALFNLHVLPPGRVLFALKGVAERPEAAEPDMAQRIGHVKALAQAAWTLEQTWLARRVGAEAFERGVAAAQLEADRNLSGVFGYLESLGYLDGSEHHAALDAVRDVLFPGGPEPLLADATVARIDVVLAAIKRVRDELPEPMRRLELQPHLDALEASHLAWKAALASGDDGSGFEAVLAARGALRAGLCVLISAIVARWSDGAEGNDERRAGLLLPILAQDQEVGGAIDRTARVSDVDPETGAELPPLIERREPGGAP